VVEPVQDDGHVVQEVVWEVAVEVEALTKLKGAFVGFLTEP
jgi:hypothetical protein